MDQLLVYADGGSRGNPGPSAYGSIIFDPTTGQVLVERGGYLGIATNNFAEYHGMIAGLESALELNERALIEIRMDSKLVVEQMSGRWKIKHPELRQLALQASRLAPPGRVKYLWVPREQNSLADALVNEALDSALAGNPTPIVRKLPVS